MRTLRFVKSEDKRKRIARETMDIYAPLAERIGMQRFKDELDDLAFAELNPDARNSIVARLEFLEEQGVDLLQGYYFGRPDTEAPWTARDVRVDAVKRSQAPIFGVVGGRSS